MSAAVSWEAASDELPNEVATALEASDDQDLAGLQLVFAVPEWEVDLPGGTTTSNTDILALARNGPRLGGCCC